MTEGNRGWAPRYTRLKAVDRIRQQVGIPWRAQTVDQIVAGAENTPVHGIATGMMQQLGWQKNAL